MSDKPPRRHVNISFDSLFWPLLVVLAMVSIFKGYSCHGCGHCHAPGVEAER